MYFRGQRTLYGRYWGSRHFLANLHFETCYYQPIEYAIAHGLSSFEAGARGTHKLARG
ncbi:MAG: GNAT family N-acetyltransferase [Gammaproteobacteria bacterium]|nr:GNAT family N-acetyltransferase [Gammaproteobacteria bacterium]